MPLKFSVTQVMIGHLDLVESCQLMQKLGYDALELRVRYTDGANDITPDNISERAEEIKACVAEHGLLLSNFASNQSLDAPGAMDVVRKLAEGAVACGCPAIRLGCRGYPADGSEDYWEIFEGAVKQYTEAIAITKAHGLKVFLEMHGGTIHPSASLAYRIVSNFSPEDIGVIYDPQNMVRDGFETIPLALQLLGPYVVSPLRNPPLLVVCASFSDRLLMMAGPRSHRRSRAVPTPGKIGLDLCHKCQHPQTGLFIN